MSSYILSPIKTVATKLGVSKPAQTVDAVLATFRKTVADLRAVEEQQCALADEKNDQAAQLLTESNAARREAQRAAAAAGKIEAVFS